MSWIFWIAFGFCAYTLFGYALCLAILSLLPRRTRKRELIFPSVSILIAVRNAENVVEAKIRNCRALNYPKEQMEIVIVCDGPSAVVEQIAQSFNDPRVRVLNVPARGKTFALGEALKNSSGEIIVFTDVGVMLDPEGVREIVCNFADPKVGCVSSEDVTPKTPGNAEPLYISMDMRLRRWESSVRSLVNASGSFFAAKREMCKRWNYGMSSDFFVPLNCIEAGFDTVVEPKALGYVKAVKVEHEYERKVRTIVHGLDVLILYGHLLNPLAYGIVAWELMSHKLFRWMLPIAFFAMFFSNCLLWNSGWLYRVALTCQIVIYGSGILDRSFKPLQRFLPFRISGFFLLGNVATVKACWLYIKGERYVSWTPSKRDVAVG